MIGITKVDKMKFLRIILLISILLLMLIFGYFRERYLLVFSADTVFTFINKYPRIATTNFSNELNNFFLFQLSPKLISSLLFSLIFATLAIVFTYVLTKSKFFMRLITGAYAFYVIICFILIVMGNMGVDYHLSYGLSHYLEDLFLSPFILMMLVPVYLLQTKRNEIGT